MSKSINYRNLRKYNMWNIYSYPLWTRAKCRHRRLKCADSCNGKILSYLILSVILPFWGKFLWQVSLFSACNFFDHLNIRVICWSWTIKRIVVYILLLSQNCVRYIVLFWRFFMCNRFLKLNLWIRLKFNESPGLI